MKTSWTEIVLQMKEARSLRAKMKVIAMISQEHIDNHVSEVLDILGKPLRMAERADNHKAQAECLVLRGICYCLKARFTDAVEDLELAVKLYNQMEDVRGAATATMRLAYAQSHLGQVSLSLSMCDTAADIFESLGDNSNLAAVYEQVADHYSVLRDHHSALKYGLRSIELLRGEEQSQQLARCYRNVGRVYEKMEDFEKSREYCLKSIAINRALGNTFQEVTTRMRLAVSDAYSYYKAGTPLPLDELIGAVTNALELYRRTKADKSIPDAWYFLGMLYYWGGKHAKALDSFLEVEKIAECSGRYDVTASSSLLQMGIIHAEAGENEQAREYLERTYVNGCEIDRTSADYLVAKHLSALYEAQGCLAKALDFYKRYAKARAVIDGKERQKSLTTLQLRSEVESARRQREVIRLEKENLEQDVNFKQREITALTLYLSQKNRMLSSVRGLVEKTVEAPTELRDDLLQTVLAHIDDYLHSEEDWQAFETQYTLAHGNVVHKLAAAHPSLSISELRICCLIKIQLSTKEIARMMCCSVRSIETYRYRLRKKLDLPRYTSLADYLATV